MDTNIKVEVNNAYLEKLKGKLFGVLKEREKEGKWERFLESIQIELMGFPEEKQTINYMIICNKLGAAKFLRYPYFRSTILDCMNLIDGFREKDGA